MNLLHWMDSSVKTTNFRQLINIFFLSITEAVETEQTMVGQKIGIEYEPICEPIDNFLLSAHKTGSQIAEVNKQGDFVRSSLKIMQIGE